MAEVANIATATAPAQVELREHLVRAQCYLSNGYTDAASSAIRDALFVVDNADDAAASLDASGYVFHCGPDGVRLISNTDAEGAPAWTLTLDGRVEDPRVAVDEIRRDLARGEYRAEGREAK